MPPQPKPSPTKPGRVLKGLYGEPQTGNRRNIMEYKDPGRHIPIIFLLYAWGSLLGVPSIMSLLSPKSLEDRKLCGRLRWIFARWVEGLGFRGFTV